MSIRRTCSVKALVTLIALTSLMAMALCACAGEKLSCDSAEDGKQVHVSAENSTGETIGSAYTEEGDVMSISADVPDGTIQLVLINKENDIFYDEELVDKSFIELSPYPTGEITVKVKTTAASGTVDISVASGSISSGDDDEEGNPTKGEAASPWESVANVAEAAAKAGLDDEFAIPKSVEMAGETYLPELFSAAGGVAEAVFQNDAGSICVRKASDEDGDDISGDFNFYEEEWVWELGGRQVSCKGYDGKHAAHMHWIADGSRYSVVCFGLDGPVGMTQQEAESIIGSIR